MTEEFLNKSKISALIQQMGGNRVPEHMRMQVFAYSRFESGLLKPATGLSRVERFFGVSRTFEEVAGLICHGFKLG
jgi:hypothetical protein